LEKAQAEHVLGQAVDRLHNFDKIYKSKLDKRQQQLERQRYETEGKEETFAPKINQTYREKKSDVTESASF